MFLPPFTFSSTPEAPWSGASKSGLEMAETAASMAADFPLPFPTAMKAGPEPAIRARMSAKSTLISPGEATTSEIPSTPCLRVSSAS